MKVDRLFHVLVLMSGAGACDLNDEGRERRDPPPDAPTSTGDGAMSTTDGSVELAPCFCDTQSCCDRSTEPAHVVDGFECCWSNTCP